MSNENLGNFVGVLITTLRGEIGETRLRAERLGAALKHGREARAAATHALETSRAQREAREARLMRANEARDAGSG